MYTVLNSVKEAVLSVLGFSTTGEIPKNIRLSHRYRVDTQLQEHKLYTTVLPRHSTLLHPICIPPHLLTTHMESLQPTEQFPPTEANPCLIKSQTGSTTSLTLSDSEEESGYMSCTSGGKKARYSKDIENLLANHSDSSKSLNSSLNDVSSCEPNDSREQSQDDDVDEGERPHLYASYLSTANVVLTKVTSLDTPSSPEPQQPEEELDGEDSEREEGSSDESSDDDNDEGTNQKSERTPDSEDEAGDTDDEEDGEEGGEGESEEDDKQDDEENKLRKSLQRQTTVISKKEDDDETTSCDDETVEFPDKKKKRKTRKASSSSSGTWISEDDEKCVGVTTKNAANDDDSDSDGPAIGDFFDGMHENVSYTFFEQEPEEVLTYPSAQFFTHSRSSPVFGPETMITEADDDDDDDFGYIYNSDLQTGKRYAFPRREPRTIRDAVDFWETDFEVKGCIYPCMSSWEKKCLVPSYEEDAEDYMKYNMYKSLYDKWVKCNRSTEQWAQRYWGRSIEYVARMKGAPKPPMVTSQSNSNVEDSDTTLPELCRVDPSVADRRRRRRNDAISVTRGMY